jgi:hypothetical protein
VEADWLDCPPVATFDNQPDSTTGKRWRPKLYLTASGQSGVIPRRDGSPAALAASEEIG